jgi:hypothetical protein
MAQYDRVKVGISLAKHLLTWARSEAGKRGLTLSAYLATLVDAERQRGHAPQR